MNSRRSQITNQVRPGQIWRDRDKRGYGRWVRITEIIESDIDGGGGRVDHGTRFAVTEPCDQHGQPVRGRSTRIRIDRFRPVANGYDLVQDVEAGK